MKVTTKLLDKVNFIVRVCDKGLYHPDLEILQLCREVKSWPEDSITHDQVLDISELYSCIRG